MPEIDVLDGEWCIKPPAGQNLQIGYSGWSGKVQIVGGEFDAHQIGETADVLYGGDMSGDSAGLGVKLLSADGTKHFAYAVYADDGGAELDAGWVSGIFGSMVIYTAVTPSCNLSAFGVTGQLHVGASVATIGNLCGVYGIAECDGSEAINGNFFGGLFGATLGASATIGSGYYTGGVMIGGNYQGTHTGKAVAIFVQNPTGAKQFDAFAAIGQDSQYAGCVTAGAVGGSQTHKLKIYMGGTLMYIPLNTA